MKTVESARFFVALCTALLLARAARAQEVTISEKARTHFTSGVRLLQDPGGARYEEAYQEFRVAYADSPSPRMLGNVGLCAMKLERDEEAIHAYEKYLAGVPNLDSAERTQIESDLVTLKASLVRVTLAVSTSDVRIADVRTPVQGAPITNVYGPLPAGSIQLGIHPGHHVITVKRDGYQPSAWEFDALPNASVSRTFELHELGERAHATPPPPLGPVRGPVPAAPPPEVYRRPTPASVWAMTGVTVALGAAAAVTGGLAVSKRSSYDALNDGTRVPDAEALRDTGQRLNVATDVLIGTTVAAAAVTVILYATRPSVKPKTELLTGVRLGAPLTGVRLAPLTGVRLGAPLTGVRLGALPAIAWAF
jgi:hypothetical protein